MADALKILILEDSIADVEIIQRVLLKANMHCMFHLAMDKNSFLKALEEFSLDLILSDNSLPQFDAMEALLITRQRFSHLPFILVTGTVSEEFAAGIIRQGADDYLLKDRLARLPAAIDAAIKQRKSEKENKEAQQKIIRSETNLRTIFENTSEGFLLMDRDGIVKALNSKAIEYPFFINKNELEIGYSLFNFIDPSRVTFFKGVIAKVLTKEPVYYDISYDLGNGKTQWIDFSVTPVIEDGKVTGICITGRDITEKKIAEQQKEFASNNLHALINNTNDLMWSTDREYKLITANKAFDKVVLLMSGKVPTKGSDIFDARFNNEQLQRFKKYYDRAFLGEVFKVIEYSSEPVEFWSEISFYPIYEGEAVIGTACFSRNITEQKKADEQLKKSDGEKQAIAERMSTILNTLPANIALLDAKGCVVEVNDAWKKFADENGYEGTDYGIGDDYVKISGGSSGKDEVDGKSAADGIRDVLDHKLKEFVLEYPCDIPGFKKWFRMVVTPLADKEYGGAVVMHIDISELRRLEQERLEIKMDGQKKITETMLFAQEKERNAIAQDLHDNLNQILAGTNLFLSIARKHPENRLEYIESSMNNIQAAIEENRRIAHELVAPVFEETQLTELLNSLIKNMLKKSGIDVHIDTSILNEDLLGDEQKLAIYRIAQEQCTNIIKYAQARSAKISLSTADGIFKMMVADDGKGMATGKKISGIGLRNIKGRLSLLNGEAIIITSPGKGFMLEITMPLLK